MPSRRSIRAKLSTIGSTRSAASSRARATPLHATVPAVHRIPPEAVAAPAALTAQIALSLGIELPVVTRILELSLSRFSRSKWLLAGIGLLLLLFLICFRYPFGASYFYEISTFGLAAVVALMTYALVHWIVPPTLYLRLGIRTSLRSVFAGLVLAQATISAVATLSLLFLALLTQRFAASTPGSMVAGTIGLLANCILLGTVTVALGTPATNRLMRLAFLLWLLLALASYQTTGLLGTLLLVTRLPLLPFAACYDFGVTGTIGLLGLLALSIQILGVGGIVWFCDISLRRRIQERQERVRRATPVASTR